MDEDDIFPELPWDNEDCKLPGPYTERPKKAWNWLKEHSSIIGLVMAVIL